jgi:hypothetical protein
MGRPIVIMWSAVAAKEVDPSHWLLSPFGDKKKKVFEALPVLLAGDAPWETRVTEFAEVGKICKHARFGSQGTLFWLYLEPVHGEED